MAVDHSAYRVLGVDPGSLFTGYGIVQSNGRKLESVAQGVIRLPADQPHEIRLHELFKELERLISLYQPHVVSIENVFMAKNPNSALKLGQVRGVVLLAASRSEVQVAEYSTTQVKKLVSGYGLADKAAVQNWVVRLLGPLEFMRHDASDALAIALTHHLNCGNSMNHQLIQKKSKAKAKSTLTQRLLKL